VYVCPPVWPCPPASCLPGLAVRQLGGSSSTTPVGRGGQSHVRVEQAGATTSGWQDHRTGRSHVALGVKPSYHPLTTLSQIPTHLAIPSTTICGTMSIQSPRSITSGTLFHCSHKFRLQLTKPIVSHVVHYTDKQTSPTTKVLNNIILIQQVMAYASHQGGPLVLLIHWGIKGIEEPIC
jgi:hypothetical protein